jgi:hypothetical protein
MQRIGTKTATALIGCCIFAFQGNPAHSENKWAVARSPQAFPGSCYVGQPPFPPPISTQYSQILVSNLDLRKSACQKAKDLKTNDPDDNAKCFAYSTASITDCKAAGVDLPK